MTKKLIGVFTTIVAALAVVGVAWASGDDDTPTSNTAATETSARVSSSVSTPSTEGTVPDSSTSTSVDDNGGDREDDPEDDSSTTSTSIASTTSTSAAGTTSTSIDDDDDDTSTTSTTIDDNDRVVVPDGITTHNIPGVGAVSIEVSGGQLFLVTVSAPGWTVEQDKIERDRIELEFTNGEAEAEFEARIRDGRVEV